jgi:phosphoserine phosphatase RsbU/P
MSEKLLVVDDEPDLESLIRQRFRKQIREGAYNFVFAKNGLEALSRLLEHKDVGIVLSDINMPEMDGLTLLAKLNELRNPTLRTVIVSAYGDMDNIRTAMNRGAYDFLTKPVDFADLEQTIEKTIRELEQSRNAIREHDKLVAIQVDLDTARSIQSAILPKTFPKHPAFELYAAMEPAKEVGGDLYDFFMLDNDRIGLVIGDVSGKGVPAAIFMAVSRTLLRATALEGRPPDRCLTYVNDLLYNESVASMFVTVFYGVLNVRTGELIYANGGHNPPYIVGRNGKVRIVPQVEGLVLGIMPEVEFKTGAIQLNSGDHLFTFTDGVTEAMNKDQDLYTEERLEGLLASKGELAVTDLVKEVFADVHRYADGTVQSDDITVLSLKLLGDGRQ